MKKALIKLYNFIYYKCRDISSYSTLLGAKKENMLMLRYLRKHNIPSEAKLLDVGCGFGRNLTLLSENGYNILGIEINDKIIEANLNKGLNCCTPEDFVKNKHVCDLVIMSHVIEHMDPDKLLEFMDFYLDFLKPAGQLIIATPHLTKQFYLDFDHIKPYSHVGIESVFYNQKQVQYYSRNKIRTNKVSHIRIPYNHRLISYRTQTLGVIASGIVDFVCVVLYYISFTMIGIDANWIGSFTKIKNVNNNNA